MALGRMLRNRRVMDAFCRRRLCIAGLNDDRMRLKRLLDQEELGKFGFDSSPSHLVRLKAIYDDLVDSDDNVKSFGALLEESSSLSKEELTLINAELEDELIKLRSLKRRFFESLFANELCQLDDEILFEIVAGVGGKEAALFANELYRMYLQYAVYKRWTTDTIAKSEAEMGIKSITFSVKGKGALKALRFEGGVHRVQRIPVTERSGRIHTSTAAVSVLPMPKEVAAVVNLKDVRVDTFRSSSKGGQNVNKIESAVRLVHIPTGIIVECQVERSQEMNKKKAMRKLAAILHQQLESKQQKEQTAQRKLQVGLLGRSEKIRTYNFPDDRVTDHRIKRSFNGIAEMMKGEQQLDHLLEALYTFDYDEKVYAVLSAISKTMHMETTKS